MPHHHHRAATLTLAALVPLASLTGCTGDDGGDEVSAETDTETTESSTGTDSESSSGTDSGTDTDTDSSTDSSTDTDSGTDTDSSTDSGTGTETDSSTDTDTDTDTDTGGEDPGEAVYTPPTEAALPCLSLGAGPQQVIGAYAQQPDFDLLPGRVYFVRADGSDFLAREQLERFFVVGGNADSVLITAEGECFNTSVAAMLDRETGMPLWEDLALPHAVGIGVGEIVVQADGRAVIRASDCDDPEPYFMVIADGQLLDSGYGDPIHRRIRADDFLPLFRPYYENDPPVEDRWRWRNVVSKQELGPTHSFAAWGSSPLYLAGGELVYFADVDGQHVVVVEEPGAVQPVSSPTLHTLVEAGWTLQLSWRDFYDARPYGWDSEWTMIRAVGPDPDRWFALTPEHAIVEVTPQLPPGQQSALSCINPGLDAVGRLLMPWFDGDVAKVWLEVTADQWTARSLPLYDVGNVGVATLAPGTTYVHATADYGNYCNDSWGQAPADGVIGQGSQYVRGTHIYRPPNNRAHRADPSARCVAAPQTVPFQSAGFGSEWTLHDLENNEFFALPPWFSGNFHWFSN